MRESKPENYIYLIVIFVIIGGAKVIRHYIDNNRHDNSFSKLLKFSDRPKEPDYLEKLTYSPWHGINTFSFTREEGDGIIDVNMVANSELKLNKDSTYKELDTLTITISYRQLDMRCIAEGKIRYTEEGDLLSLSETSFNEKRKDYTVEKLGDIIIKENNTTISEEDIITEVYLKIDDFVRGLRENNDETYYKIEKLTNQTFVVKENDDSTNETTYSYHRDK